MLGHRRELPRKGRPGANDAAPRDNLAKFSEEVFLVASPRRGDNPIPNQLLAHSPSQPWPRTTRWPQHG